MLKVASPFREKKEVSLLIEAGADELYCGYLPAEWKKKYTGLEFERKGGNSNFRDLEELRSAVDLAHKKNTPVYLTLNGLYVNAQYPLLLKIIDQVETIDFDAFIIADIGLLLTLRKRNTKKKIHISTGGTVFNSQAVDFYRRLGASRIVLDRQTTFKSMKALSEGAPDIEFEVFILNTLCVYIDGFCTFLHTYGIDSQEYIKHKNWEKDKRIGVLSMYDSEAVGDACCLKYSIQTYDTRFKKINNFSIKPTFFKHLIDGVECGVCAMYYINRTKVTSVKIVGRQLNPENRLISTKLVRSCLNILKKDKDISRQEYIKRAQQLYQENFKYKGECRGNNCYYPGALL
jgi:putative protease